MKLQKPRVYVDVDSVFANVKWDPVPGSTFYTVKYSFSNTKQIINTLNVTSCSATLTSLLPNTDYIVFVSTTIVNQTSQETVINFKTLSTSLMENKGSGSTLYPDELTDMYNLEATTVGYKFNKSKNALFVDSKPFQFVTFDLGILENKTHINLQLLGAAGNWTISEQTKHHFDNTLLFIKIQNVTGWMDANTLRIPGVKDLDDGARAFDGNVGDELNSIRATLASIGNNSYAGRLFVRVGLSDSDQTIAGIKIFS
tara:strand:- start:791 stop:1558 length:768 start_codon:yes stop_codon:yes gene_type:complete